MGEKAIEDCLASEGVREVFTYGSDLEFDTDGYRQCLSGRSYVVMNPTRIQLPVYTKSLFGHKF